MSELLEAIEKADLSTIELANAISDIMITNYGEHNFESFKEVINTRLIKST